ncbi:MAG TPA: SPW repeat protein [Thermomicrobiales bacterium]|nr:SPW repeat protein [Thermomicrobiales bacterium]
MSAHTNDTLGPVRAASGLNVLAGIWLIVAPWVLGYTSSEAHWNEVIFGIVVGILALIRFSAPLETVWLSWINFLVGVWLIIAPFALVYTTPRAYWNEVGIGILVLLLALWSALMTQPCPRRVI